MSLYSRFSEEDIIKWLIDLINLNEWSAKKEFLQKHPQLLSEEADRIMTRVIDGARRGQNHTLYQAVVEHRALIVDCRNYGIDATFAKRLENVRNWAPSNELIGIMQEISQPSQLDQLPRRIKLLHKALKLVPRHANPELWAGLQFELGSSLGQDRSGDWAGNMEQAIDHLEQALTVFTPLDFPEPWANIQNNLGNIYRERLFGKRRENIETAINHYNQVFQVIDRQVHPVKWANTMNNLGNAYTDRIQGDKVENQEQAILCFKKALEVRINAKFPQEWAETIHNLAAVYRERVKGDRSENLEKAINYYEQSLRVFEYKTYPNSWAMVNYNLGNVYFERLYGLRAENIERAIQHYKLALQIRTSEAYPIDWAITQHGLAEAYREQIQGEQTENREQALYHFQQALTVVEEPSHPELWALINSNLANTYRERLRGNTSDNMEQAILHFQKALRVYTKKDYPEGWAKTQDLLGIVYLFRHKGTRASNVESAIAHHQNALEVYTDDIFPEQWAQVRGNLGNAFLYRKKGITTENLEQAISCHKSALSVYSRVDYLVEWARTHYNLAAIYAIGGPGTSNDNLERALDHLTFASQVYKPETLPVEYRLVQNSIGDLHFWQRRWLEAFEAYKKTILIGNQLYETGATRDARYVELREQRNLSASAAYCLAKLGDWQQAITILEQGKTRVLSEVLARNEAALEDASEADLKAFMKVRERISQLEAEARAVGQPWARDFLAVSADLRQARKELSVTIERIRSYVSGFMSEGLGFTDIVAVATAMGKPLVYLLTTIYGSLALIMSPNDPKKFLQQSNIYHIWLNDFKDNDLNNVLYDQAGKKRYLHGAVQGETRILMNILNTFGLDLRSKMLSPVVKQLKKLKYEDAVLIPTGTLSLLPLHSLTLDAMTFTWAPSARALQSALKLAQERATWSPTLLGVGNPTADDQSPLTFSRLEVETIATLFGATMNECLVEATATRKAVIEQASNRTHFHFACHGRFAIEQPLDSSLYLAGSDTLTLRDLLDGQLNLSSARLAVLSACQTGITDFQNVPDEAIGFPAGFLQAGVPGVISTLWPVADISTALLLIHFYRYHLKDELPPAQALRQAQLWLRDVTAGELAEHFRGERLTLMTSHMTMEQASVYWRSFAAEDPASRPFAHPYYWAAFTFTGA